MNLNHSMVFGTDPLLASIIGILIGAFIGYLMRQVIAKQQINSAEIKAERIANEAKNKAQEILLESKNKAIKILDDTKKDQEVRQAQLLRIEKMLERKEEEIDQSKKQVEEEKKTIKQKGEDLLILKNDLEQKRAQQITELEKIGSMKRQEAKDLLFKKVEEENKEDIYAKLIKIERDGKEVLEQKAKEIMAMAIQRYAQSHINEVTTTVVQLPSDEIKGKIIGKEGRNIKAIERLTGVDLIVDDTPEAMIISGFDPVRRQTAKLAIEKLIADGRIHPAKIEEMVEKAKTEIDQKIKQAGEEALFETGIGPLDQRLTYLLGRLAFRTSFGQNVLIHSTEMTHIAGMLAEELHADVMIAKKGALLHDIGKAVDHEVQGTHVEIGRKILQKFSVDEKVILAMQSHHEEYPYATLEARIVQAADAISAARPGARRDTVEFYLKRLEDLERIAGSFEAVEKSYAIQAGRELRVFVTPNKIDDLGAIKLAKDIAKKIEEEMKFPGEIKVNVIRETRAIEYAR